MHTTVTVDGVEHHELRPEHLFRLYEAGVPTTVTRTSGEAVGVLGSHTGYRRLGVSHSRRITMSGTGLIVAEDTFEGTRGHRLMWSFPLHPSIKTEVDDQGVRLVGPRGEARIITPDLELTECESWYSRGYGQRVPTRRLEAVRDDGPSRVVWVLLPVAPEGKDSDSNPFDIGQATRLAESLWSTTGPPTSEVA